MQNPDGLLIFTPGITARISYMVSVFFDGAVLLTDSRTRFLDHAGARINYSPEKISDKELWVVPHGLLTERKIAAQKLSCTEWEGNKVFFETGGDIPFDIFSAAFYLLSRYEEYLPYEPDKYGRYPHTDSLACKEGFLQIPLVNLWLVSFWKKMTDRFPALDTPRRHTPFRYIPTYDIDIAYSYLHKPAWKNVLGFYRDLLQGKFEQVMERGNVYSGRKKDPFDVFDWMDALHERYGLKPIYFLLTIIKRGEYDKNLLARSPALQQLYRRIAKAYTTGIHPSWQSGTDEWLLEKEIETLQTITGKPVKFSRNHYLRFTVPHTCRRLIAAGITDDHSMAYGAINGFRASYALPYRWYDLERECMTPLTIHPFCFMEASSFFEQGYGASQAGEELQYYHDTVKNVNGELITLFHNHFLTEQAEWIAWREMYEAFLAKNFGGPPGEPTAEAGRSSDGAQG